MPQAEENVVVVRCLGDAVRKQDGVELETWLELADSRGCRGLQALHTMLASLREREAQALRRMEREQQTYAELQFVLETRE